MNAAIYIYELINLLGLQRWSSLAEEVGSIVKEYPKLTLTQGRKVWTCLKKLQELVIINVLLLRYLHS